MDGRWKGVGRLLHQPANNEGQQQWGRSGRDSQRAMKEAEPRDTCNWLGMELTKREVPGMTPKRPSLPLAFPPPASCTTPPTFQELEVGE